MKLALARPAGALAAVALAVAALALPTSASADTKPKAGTPATVSTDALPTVQINGVVWTQTVIGDTVYAAGRFSKARPAGAKAGHHENRVYNMLAYDITTGEQIMSFKPRFNSEVRAIVAKGDTIYAVGNFTAVNGKKHTRIAAIDATTGKNEPFKGSLNSLAYAVAVHGGTVYAGGQFTAASGRTRIRLAAFSTSTGALKAWHPSANRAVQAMAVAPDGKSVVVGGHFNHLNGRLAEGSGRVNTGSGRTNLSWAVNKAVQNNGPDAAIYSMSGDDEYVYMSGYSYHPLTVQKRLEGVVAASWTGKLHWIEDCKGDTYDTAPMNGVLYTASHSHDCSTMGAFTQSKKPIRYNHSLAFTIATEGKVKKQTKPQYTNFGGKPAPKILNWYPAWKVGRFTGQNQAVWSVHADPQGRYLVYGGEFLAVNGNSQQGLTRFAVSSIAPNTDGPRLSGTDMRPTLKALGGGKVKVTVKTDFDRDNQYLTYQIVRVGDPATEVATVVKGSRYYYDRPSFSVTDTGLTKGQKVAYKVYVTDPFGNRAIGAEKTVTVK